MKKYKVQVVETLCKDFVVEADSEDEAWDVVEERINDMNPPTEWILTADDFCGRGIDVLEETDEEVTPYDENEG